MQLCVVSRVYIPKFYQQIKIIFSLRKKEKLSDQKHFVVYLYFMTYLRINVTIVIIMIHMHANILLIIKIKINASILKQI